MRASKMILAAACCLTLVLAAGDAEAFRFGGKGVEGSGDLETRTLDLDDFTALQLGGAFEIDISFGDEQSVEITIDDNLWDLLEAEVSRGTFEIGWSKSVRPSDDCRVEIVVRSLEEMSISGAGDVRVHDFEGDSFEFHLSGAAELDMDGRVDDLDIQVSGAGEIDTRDLEARHVKIRISGAADAKIYASESLDARVSGVGNIEYWGDPEERKTNTSGFGKIRKRS